MGQNFKLCEFCFFIKIFLLGLLLPQFLLASAGTVVIEAKVVSLCGNGVINQGEECDGNNFAGHTCQTSGFSGGFLTCNANCTINTSQCTTLTTSPSGGSGGSSEFLVAPDTPDTKVVFSGLAYPGMKVTLLKDGQIAASTIADQAANFLMTVSGLSVGGYIFGVSTEDSQGRKSMTLTFSVIVTSGVTVEVGGIFIAPTIAVDKNKVKKGDSIAIFGQSAPKANVTVAINSETEFFGKTTADQSGAYLYSFNTTKLEKGEHLTKSKAIIGGAISSFGKAVSFVVGSKTIFVKPLSDSFRVDFNSDGRVDLIDFSIMAYWYKRPLSAAFKIKEEQLNGDGQVNLIDFSIMAFYWTG